MARVNVDERWWSDPRRSRLIDLLGSRRHADGLIIEVWRIGQEYEAKGKSVPFVMFDEKELECLIKCGLAEKNAFGVYVKGSKKHTEFLNGSSQSERGKASVRARILKYGTAQPINGRGFKSNIKADNGTESNQRFVFNEHSSSSSKKETTTTCHFAENDLNKLAEIWNSNCGDLPKMEKMTAKRKRICSAIIKKFKTEELIAAAKSLAKSPFHTGKNNTGWRANFDFFIREENIAKAIEGCYQLHTEKEKKEITFEFEEENV